MRRWQKKKLTLCHPPPHSTSLHWRGWSVAKAKLKPRDDNSNPIPFARPFVRARTNVEMKRRRVDESGGGGRKPTLRLGIAAPAVSSSGAMTPTATAGAADGGCVSGGEKKDKGKLTADDEPLALGWQQCLDVKTGQPYYWKPSTNETSWDRPTR